MTGLSLGIDFGTSNTAAAVMIGGRAHVIALEDGRNTLPTAVFFDTSARKTLFGHAAVSALIEGREGRFMRSLKSILGTPLMREKRKFGHEQMTFIDVVARFLAEVKARAETFCHQSFDTALSGRPVHFHSSNPARDAQALADLTECYHRAGFRNVRFLAEPEAAARARGAMITNGTLGLIVDIGGGTSDFSLFRTTATGIDILSSHGVRVGGTDFDKAISLSHVMPLLGKGTELRHVFGSETSTAPVRLFNELATWEKIPFLYTNETRRAVAEMEDMAISPQRFARFTHVLESELGHDIAFAVERGKIAANTDAAGQINLAMIEPGLARPLTQTDIARDLAQLSDQITLAARECLARAACPPGDVAAVVFVGGSSLMGVVTDAMRALLPTAAFKQADAFTAVVAGLAIAAADPPA